jgi:biotin--protein ligase
MSTICIYRDKGVSLTYALLLYQELKKNQPTKTLRWVKAKNLTEDHWEEDCSLLIIPGGQDVYYHELLKGAPNQRIRSFVENGGVYIGICAGAYYGCSSLEFDVDHPLEVIGKRELEFFSGVARGPAYGYGTFCYKSEKGGHISKLKLHDESIAYAYFNGGCYFDSFIESDQVSILAKYADIPNEPAALIKAEIGKGRAILCGFHPEVSADNYVTKDPYFANQKEMLGSVESSRKSLFEFIIKTALDPVYTATSEH